MTYRTVVALVAALAVCLGLAACGSAGSSSGAQVSSQSASGERAASTSPSSATTHESAAKEQFGAEKQPGAEEQSRAEAVGISEIVLKVNGTTFAMVLAETEAASALAASLQDGPISVDVHSYGGFEKVGSLPSALPASDEQITTAPGDVMLYQGNQITIFHGSNTWAYTPLGHIEGATAESLIAAFGDGDATVELALQ